jgi:predicted DNA-binding protein
MSAIAHHPPKAPKAPRCSVSFPREVYEDLERLAAAKKVSLAWIVRDAAEKYLADQWPLLANSARKEKP